MNAPMLTRGRSAKSILIWRQYEDPHCASGCRLSHFLLHADFQFLLTDITKLSKQSGRQRISYSKPDFIGIARREHLSWRTTTLLKLPKKLLTRPPPRLALTHSRRKYEETCGPISASQFILLRTQGTHYARKYVRRLQCFNLHTY